MFTLILVGLLAGMITSISPCVLPVLPVILAVGTSRPDGSPAPAAAPATGAKARKQPVPRSPAAELAAEKAAKRGRGSVVTDEPPPRIRSWRPFGVVAGLVLSFSVSTLFGSVVLSALHLPQDLLRNAGIAVLAIIGLSLLVPQVGELLEKPFARLPRRTVNPQGNGFVLGLGLGLLFVPCAGPVLATIAVVGATHRIGLDAVVLTAAFGVGVGVPLLVLALAGDALSRRVGALRRRAKGLRIASGVAMLLVAALIAFNLTDGLQRHVPGYTTALQNKIEQSNSAAARLRSLTANSNGPGALADGAKTAKSAAPDASDAPATKSKAPSTKCVAGASSLVDCGAAPDFTGINSWLNTPGDQPLSLAGLRGKVVLIDFWTYSCINCQRTLPYLEAWYRNYHADGLEIVGVHTPEFAFEHVRSNVQAQAEALGVKYPIAIDNDYGTWNAYGNQYWPAEYLIDSAGNVRHVTFGEGGYSDTEALIRQLLAQANPGTALGKSTDVKAAAPAGDGTPETYLGYQYKPLHTSGTTPVEKLAHTYAFPAKVADDTFALSGQWTSNAEELTAGADAQLKLSFSADKVYLVLGGTGSVTVEVNGTAVRTIAVRGVPRLYQLATTPSAARSLLTLTVARGVQAYDFTFG